MKRYVFRAMQEEVVEADSEEQARELLNSILGFDTFDFDLVDVEDI